MKNNKPNPKAGITRRDFIGTAAAATAFTIVPRHVLGQTASVARTKSRAGHARHLFYLKHNPVNPVILSDKINIRYPAV